ncbi:MAG: DUF1013 domain-containing protein [Hyphomicrobiales bacterium]
MSDAPLMPKATAVWLIENTGLTFDQIADFCRLHPLEVKGIADGDVAQGIKGLDPVASGQLSRDEIEKGEKDSKYRLKMSQSSTGIPVAKARKGPRYTPVSRRQDRPDAIAWLLRYHPELSDAQIIKLVGTTKPTIQAIRDRTHWNSSQIKPVDPVTLGLCSQLDLDLAVQKAASRIAKNTAAEAPKTLLPASETTAAQAEAEETPAAPEPSAPENTGEPDYDPDQVLARLQALRREPEEDDDDKKD